MWMHSTRCRMLSSLLLVAFVSQAAEPLSAPPPMLAPVAKTPEPSRFDFSLLPKSFQKNPSLEITVMGEVTDEGKKLPPVSPEKPAYFTLVSAGYHPVGDDYGEKTLKADDIEHILSQALATNGYFPAKMPEQSSLLIIFTWGPHNRVRDNNDPEVQKRNFLERAGLVGGEKFAMKAAKLLQEQTDQQDGGSGMPSFVLAFINPFKGYAMTSSKHDFMLSQARRELYYVIATAYDYPSAVRNQRRLLWRTRMTVDSAGVSQEQTLSTLIAHAGPFFGKEMAEPEILTPRAREGRVEIGTPTVVNDEAAPQPANKPASPAKPKVP
jgi:hypothetical protein